jgi:Uncharacterized protein conserved in bacteria (DUF2330)
MKFARALALVPVLSLASLTYLEAEAKACGGCFAPPEDNTVVTDHRMVLAVSPQQTTLYDQIRYQGSPSSFAWVLPIKGTVNVGISSDAVFAVLDNQTSVQVQPPPINCPPPPNCDQQRGGAVSAPTAAEDSNSGVTVLKQETVGPYETVQLRSSDPNALGNWLTSHGYSVTPEVAPVINAYVAEQFDFLALKLVPGTGVRSMRPVRVSAPGAGAGLPLRMVAAGTGAQVGVSLFVLGDGRWEPQNFQQFTIKAEELLWDWKANASNFKELRIKKNSDLGGSAWEQESSISLNATNLEQQISYTAQGNGIDATDDYGPVKNDQGQIVKTRQEVFAEDMGVLLGNNRGNLRVTRMRADLPQASLHADLALRASADQSELNRFRQVTREANEPQCPVYNACEVVGQAPRAEAAAKSAANGATWGTRGGCSTSASSPGIALALGAIRNRRRR